MGVPSHACPLFRGVESTMIGCGAHGLSAAGLFSAAVECVGVCRPARLVSLVFFFPADDKSVRPRASGNAMFAWGCMIM